MSVAILSVVVPVFASIISSINVFVMVSFGGNVIPSCDAFLRLPTLFRISSIAVVSLFIFVFTNLFARFANCAIASLTILSEDSSSITRSFV